MTAPPVRNARISTVTPQSGIAQAFSLREFLTMLFRDARLYGMIAAIPVLLTLPLAVTASKSYTATATVLVRVGKEYLYRPDITERNDAPMPVTFENARMLKSEVEILGSRDLAEATLNAIGVSLIFPDLVGNDPGNSRAIKLFQQKLLIDSSKDTNLIEVSFNHPDPALSAYIVNTLIARYLEKRAKLYADPRYSFIKQQGDILKKKLRAYEDSIRDFKKKNGIVSFDRQRDNLIVRRDDALNRLASVEAALSENTAKLQSLRRNSPTLPGETLLNVQNVPFDSVEKAKIRLADQRVKEQEIRNRYRENHPMVQDAAEATVRAENELKSLEKLVAPVATRGRSPARDNLDSSIINYQALVDSGTALRTTLKQQLDEISQALNTLSEQENELHQLESEKAVVEESYQSFFKKLDQARIEEQAADERSQSVRIIQQALVPLEAKSMRKVFLISGIVGSLMLVIITAFVRETLRDTFITPEQLSRNLGLRVLAFFPHRDFDPPPKGLARYRQQWRDLQERWQRYAETARSLAGRLRWRRRRRD